MRPRLLLLSLLTLLGANSALAQSLVPCPSTSSTRRYCEAQPTTRAKPTTAPTAAGTLGSGLSLSGAYGVRVALCPEAGQTLTGTGNLRAVLWDFDSGAATGWMNSPDADLQVGSATTLANPCRVWLDRQVAVRSNAALMYVADGVGVSGGNTVTVRLSAQVAP